MISMTIAHLDPDLLLDLDLDPPPLRDPERLRDPPDPPDLLRDREPKGN